MLVLPLAAMLKLLQDFTPGCYLAVAQQALRLLSMASGQGNCRGRAFEVARIGGVVAVDIVAAVVVGNAVFAVSASCLHDQSLLAF